MDKALNDRYFLFFLDCFEKLENGGVKKNQVDFLTGFIAELCEKNDVDSARLVEIAERVEGKSYEEKSLCNRIDKLIKVLQEHESTLAGLLPNHNLQKFPMIRKIAGGGYGQRNRFILELSDIPAETISILSQPVAIDKQHAIQYRLEHLAKTPWWLRHISKNFENRRIRKFYVLIFLCQIIVLPVCFLVLVLTGMLSLTSAFFLILTLEFLCIPLKLIGKLIVSKFVEISGSGISCFALSVITEKSKGVSFENAQRQLVTGSIRADCPVCMQRYGVHSSVVIERRYQFVGDYVGRCIQNPIHLYSFDKDLMSGRMI